MSYDAPAMYFPVTKPRVIRFRGRIFVDVVPDRRSSKDMRHPKAQVQDKHRVGGVAVFLVPLQPPHPGRPS